MSEKKEEVKKNEDVEVEKEKLGKEAKKEVKESNKNIVW